MRPLTTQIPLYKEEATGNNIKSYCTSKLGESYFRPCSCVLTYNIRHSMAVNIYLGHNLNVGSFCLESLCQLFSRVCCIHRSFFVLRISSELKISLGISLSLFQEQGLCNQLSPRQYLNFIYLFFALFFLF